jgi:hypothetical protein
MHGPAEGLAISGAVAGWSGTQTKTEEKGRQGPAHNTVNDAYGTVAR